MSGSVTEEILKVAQGARLPSLAIQKETFIAGFIISAVIHGHPKGGSIEELAVSGIHTASKLPDLARHNLNYIAEEVWKKYQEERVKGKV